MEESEGFIYSISVIFILIPSSCVLDSRRSRGTTPLIGEALIGDSTFLWLLWRGRLCRSTIDALLYSPGGRTGFGNHCSMIFMC